jgi:hypothetical protein
MPRSRSADLVFWDAGTGVEMGEVIMTCPECGLHARVLPFEDQVIGDDHGKCKHRINPLNCPSLRFCLSVGRQELIESLGRSPGQREAPAV